MSRTPWHGTIGYTDRPTVDGRTLPAGNITGLGLGLNWWLILLYRDDRKGHLDTYPIGKVSWAGYTSSATNTLVGGGMVAESVPPPPQAVRDWFAQFQAGKSFACGLDMVGERGGSLRVRGLTVYADPSVAVPAWPDCAIWSGSRPVASVDFPQVSTPE